MPRNEKYKDLSQTFSAKKEDVAINDSRQLMRRNTSEAWTELELPARTNALHRPMVRGAGTPQDFRSRAGCALDTGKQ